MRWRLALYLNRNNVVAIGPGLGRSSAMTTLLATVLERLELPIVLDADGCLPVPDGPGLGVDLLADVLEACTTSVEVLGRA